MPCSIDSGNFKILSVAGGSGATLTLGLLDDIVGRCIKLDHRGGEGTRRIEFAGCVRSFGKIFCRIFGYRTLTYRSDPIASIEWFAPMLIDIANTAVGTSLDPHISTFVTCLCNREAIPRIPNSDVTMVQPSVHSLFNNLLVPPSVSVDIEEYAG